jgi:hypothetical protein
MALTVTRVARSCVLLDFGLDFGGQPVLTGPLVSEKPGYHRGATLAFTPDKQVPFMVKRATQAEVLPPGEPLTL